MKTKTIEIDLDNLVIHSCAWCEKEHTSQSNQVKFLKQHFGASVTHGICEKHTVAMLRECEVSNNVTWAKGKK